jgi:hypothetical protein
MFSFLLQACFMRHSACAACRNVLI